MKETGKKITDMNLLAPLIIESLKGGSEVKLTVTGNSMYPLLRSRVDTVVLVKTNKLKKYDIPFYKRENGKYILHRIVKIKNNELYIAGDNETIIEYPVKKEQVIGVVSGFYRNGIYFSVKNPLYKIYSFVWCKVIPNRYIILKFLIKLRQLTRKKSYE